MGRGYSRSSGVGDGAEHTVVGTTNWGWLPQVVTLPIHKEMQGHLLAPPREVICWGKKKKNTGKTVLLVAQIRANFKFGVVGIKVGH